MAIYQVTWKWTHLSQEFRNVFYYQTTVGAPSTSEWQDIADEIRTDFYNELRTFVVNSITLTGIDYRQVDVAGLFTISQPFTSGPQAGSVSGQMVPTQVAMVVSNKGATAPPNRGRTYLGGWPIASTTSGLFTSSYTDAAEAFIDLQSNLNSGGTNPLSRVAVRWNTSHTVVTAYNDLSGAASVAQPIPATQRRRRIGVGI